MGLIRFEKVTKVYQLGEEPLKALDEVSLEIGEGEFVSVMGPSGSGKSTSMHIMGCLDRPSSGTYFLDGADVGKFDDDKLAGIRNGKIGFVFQGFNLLARTPVIENVELPMLYAGVPASARRRRALEAIRTVGLAGRENSRPNQLSGGQQQRVAIARALVNEAGLILADEPTGNLDTKTSREIMELFAMLNREFSKTIVIVTHERDIASYGRRIVRFLDGRITGDSPG